MRNKVYTFFQGISVKITLGLLMAGCLTPIDLEIDKVEGSGNIVIGGQISNISDRNYVEIGITYYGGHLPDPVPRATVTLLDDRGNTHNYKENTSIPGRYELLDMSGTPGRKYHIEVKLRNGKIYHSKEELMPAQVGKDNIQHTFVTEEFIDFEGAFVSGTFLKIRTRPTFPNYKPYLCRWVIEEIYQISPVDFPDPFGNTPPDCFVTQNADPQRVSMFDGREFSASLSSDILIATKPVDQTFHYKHYFTIYQSAITPESLDYWSKINVLANQTGSIFDTPPAEITGNVKNINSVNEKVFGYFQATAQSMERFYTTRADLPKNAWLQPYCEYDNSKPNLADYPLPCQNCRSVRNSSYLRPWWF